MPQKCRALIETRGLSFLAIARRKLAETRGTPRKAVGRGFEKGRLAVARNRDLRLPAREGCELLVPRTALLHLTAHEGRKCHRNPGGVGRARREAASGANHGFYNDTTSRPIRASS